LREAGLDGWLIRDYRYSNPVIEAALGVRVQNLTRPVWLYIPRDGEPVLLAHDVDAGRFPPGSPRVARFSNRPSMITGLRQVLPKGGRVAMEYSPLCELPRVGRVDAGTIELVRSLGVQIVPSGDVMQYATERWSPEQLTSHKYAVESLVSIVREAFNFTGENIRWKLTEHDVAEFIRGRYQRLGLVADDGPVVAFNEHSSDPHYEPGPRDAAVIRRHGWLLIDLWARKTGSLENIYADLTWVASLGGQPAPREREVFGVVRDARDAAFKFLEDRVLAGDNPQGWEVDRAARSVIEKAGYGGHFVHRLGHSLGREVHANGVNLDDWETHDTRTVIQGVGITIEPGIYLPEFGVRLEMDVYMSGDGPQITAEHQTDIVLIDTSP
jgi:Xaa-Pro aminopeptidase